jgi:hypothetical protein
LLLKPRKASEVYAAWRKVAPSPQVVAALALAQVSPLVRTSPNPLECIEYSYTSPPLMVSCIVVIIMPTCEQKKRGEKGQFRP